MLYTRKGDDGVSGLYDTKERFPKNSRVYDALGTLDECNSLLGFCRVTASKQKDGVIDVAGEIMKAQECLFIIQAELAGAPNMIAQTQVETLERTIGIIEGLTKNPHTFVIPGATELSALFDYTRAVCRRAERAVIEASATHKVSQTTKSYLNRLSSLLYALARYAAAQAGVKEPSPSYQ